MKFDVVVGNPPFQPAIKKRGNGKGSANKIWQKFVEKVFVGLLNDDGHVLMVTPSKWRDGNFLKGSQHRKAQELIWSNSIIWFEDVKPYFPTIGHSIGIDGWHVRIGTSFQPIEQKLLKRWHFLPRDKSQSQIIAKFFDACERLPCFEFVFRNRRDIFVTHENRTDEQFRYANTSAQTRKQLFHWSNVQTDEFLKKKVITSNCGAFEPWFDDGTCGVRGHALAYIVDDKTEGERLIKFLNGPLIKLIVASIMQKGSFAFPGQLFMKIPLAVINGLDCFGFTEEEKEVINAL
jgi:hypothetical protein